jgi:hypothetical protein
LLLREERSPEQRSSLERRPIRTRKYSPKTQEEVHKSMREMKKGKLESGRSHKKVTNPKQAVAIGLSKARKKSARVPAKKS